ncbi:MAG: RNA polymerase sigma factor, partial [Gammaproteobacteria bacterium]|nr:RNA polymerase sigma factor [Gammaproteobacteria bacterium]
EEALAEDAVQETWLNVHRRLGKFDGRSAFTTWLQRIAINAAIDILRSRRRLQDREDMSMEFNERADHLAGNEPGPERQTESKAVGRAAREALANLTPMERAAFSLRHFEEVAIEEICQKLGIGKNACKQAIFRAVGKMRKALSDYTVHHEKI